MTKFSKRNQRTRAAKAAAQFSNPQPIKIEQEDTIIGPELLLRLKSDIEKAWHTFLDMIVDPLRPTPWDYFEMGTLITSHMRIKNKYKALYDFMILMSKRNTKGEVDESYQYIQNEDDKMFEFEDDEKAKAFYDSCAEMKIKAVLDNSFVLVRKFKQYNDESKDNIIKSVNEQDGWEYEEKN